MCNTISLQEVSTLVEHQPCNVYSLMGAPTNPHHSHSPIHFLCTALWVSYYIITLSHLSHKYACTITTIIYNTFLHDHTHIHLLPDKPYKYLNKCVYILMHMCQLAMQLNQCTLHMVGIWIDTGLFICLFKINLFKSTWFALVCFLALFILLFVSSYCQQFTFC